MRREKAAEEQGNDNANAVPQTSDPATPAENPFANADGTDNETGVNPDAGVSAGKPDSVSDDTDDIDDEDDDDDDMDFAAELRKRAFREKSDDDGNS